ncbi:MAG: chromosome segregation protein SMC [Pseudomonadota bacterium]
MRLNEIVIAGFKSFPERTVVKFPSNLNAVVGPNGCGKSNIFDAVRWVMGESSAKYMRGDMTDVIFSGSGQRNPLAQASIELIFDNSDGRLGGQYAEYNEISIKRVVNRESQSNYYLNNTRCRRKDIIDLFLGTGIGSRSYSIIMQDTISRIIEAKPDELRLYLEEAAGISKYKERRHETELRISHTKENLERLSDIREEIDKQLKHLQRQANAAKRYQTYKEEETLLRAQIAALEWQDLQTQAQTKQQAISQQASEYEQVQTAITHIDSQTETQRQAHFSANDELNKIQENLYDLRAKIAETEQAKQHQQQQLEALKQTKSATLAQIQALATKLEQAEVQKQALSDQVEEIAPELIAMKTAAQATKTALQEAEQNLKHWQTQWDEFNTEYRANSAKANVEKTRFEHLQQQEQQLTSTLRETIAVKAATAEDVETISVDAVQQSLAQHEQRTVEIEQKLTQQLELIEQTKQRRSELNQTLQTKQRNLHDFKQKIATLTGLQQAALGQTDSDLIPWLKQKNLQDKKRLGQMLKVEAGWERAIETVLANEIEAICLENSIDVQSLIESVPQTDLMLIQFSQANPNIQDAAKALPTLADKLQSALPYQYKLQHILAADNLQQAMQYRNNLKPGESIITRDGIWLGNNWLKISRKHADKTGVIERETAIKQLQEKINQHEDELGELETAIADCDAKLASLEQDQKLTRQSLTQAQQQFNDKRTELRLAEQKQENLQTKAKELADKVASLQQQLSETNIALESCQKVMEAAQLAIDSQHQHREALIANRDECQQKVDNLREQYHQSRDDIHQLELQHSQLIHQVNTLKQTLEQGRIDEANQQKQIKSIEEKLVGFDDPMVTLDQKLQTLLAERLQREKEISTAKQKLSQVEQEQQSLHAQRLQTESKLEEVRNQLEDLRIQAQQFKVKIETIETDFAQTSQSIEQALQTLTAEKSLTQLQDELTTIARRIERLGAINLAAIEEFEALTERKNYLDTQHADLVEALETLEKAIRKIDQETRHRFKATYEQANAQFEKLFPKIFGGGSASLVLTEEDLLKTGVIVMARPPGKRNATIHLLSGGEKALTAISLVFSLFQLNPAPFCMLDEVDAPLDDANVIRFCNLVKEMAKEVQFIFISHNKLAIEMAKHLIGVAMREPGVSRLVAVDIDAAVEMAGA